MFKIMRLKLALLASVVALAAAPPICAENAPATTEAPLAGYQEAVRSQMQELIRSTITDFFTHDGRASPEHIEVKSHAEFDLAQAEPQLRHLVLDVSMTSDQPAAVLREARLQIMRTLRGNGYRFEAAATPAQAGMPQVKLNLEVHGVERLEHMTGLREYAILAALGGGCAAFFVLAIIVLVNPLRRRRDSRARRVERAPGMSLPPVPQTGAVFHASAADLPPLNAVGYRQDSPQVDLELV